MRNTLVMLLCHTLNIRGQIKALGFSSLPLGLLFFLATTAHATPVILDVRDVDTPGDDSVLHVGGLTEDVSGFVDRGDGQNWINVPQSLEGADYIESAQNNADVSDDRPPGMDTLLIEVDVAEGAVLYMFIDESQPTTPFPWMNFADFGADWVDTGLDISWTRDEDIFDIWRTVGPLDAGTYNFRQMPVDSSFYGIAATSATIPVNIDIKPGKFPNRPNRLDPTSTDKKIKVGILGTMDFDATQVDQTTIRFGPDEAPPDPARCKVKDFNEDGMPDLSCKFKISETGIACGDTEATLIGATFRGEPIIGTDAVETVGCPVAQIAYFNDFDGGLAVAREVKDVLDGITTTEPVQGYSGVGNFGGDFLRNTTGGGQGSPPGPIGTPGSPTRLTLTGLREHNSIDINFLLAIIDSWDGSLPGPPPPVGCDFCHPDIFNVRVDGILVFDESFGFNGPTFVPPPGVLLTVSPLGFNPVANDAAYDMGLNPTFDNIPHTARTLTIEWFADGAGWQGGDDESWAIDNLEIILKGK